MKKSMIIVPAAIIGSGTALYLLLNRNTKKQALKLAKDVRNSMDEMIG